MFINIVIVLLMVTFLVATYFQNALYSTDMDYEKRDRITSWLSTTSPLILALGTYFLSKQTKSFFDRKWVSLWIDYYLAGFLIQALFFFWGKWKMNRYHESKK